MLEITETNSWASIYVQPENTLPRYGYRETLAASENGNRRNEDITGGDKRLSVGCAAKIPPPEGGTQNDNN